MSTITKRKGNFRYDVWETNKAHALGYCKWAIYRWYPELEVWSKIQTSNYPKTIEVALREAEDMLERHFRTDLGNQNLYTDAAQHDNALRSRFDAISEDHDQLDLK